MGTLLVTRGVLSWLFNGLLAKSGGASLLDTLFFHGITRWRLLALLLLNGTLNAVSVQLLFITLESLVSFGDTFVIIIGVYTIAVFVLSRLLGRSERVTLVEIIGGSLTVVGVALVSQPSWLFRATSRLPC